MAARCASSWIRLVLGAGLLLALGVGRAEAAVPFALPPGEDPGRWGSALALAGFVVGQAGGGTGVRVEVVDGRWRVTVRDDRGGLHVVLVDVPQTDRAREDLVWLAQSLMHPTPSLVVRGGAGPAEPPTQPDAPEVRRPPVAPRPKAPPAWVGAVEGVGARVGGAVAGEGTREVQARLREETPSAEDAARPLAAQATGGAVAGAVDVARDWYALVPTPVEPPWTATTWVSTGVQLRAGLPTVVGGAAHVRVAARAWGPEAWVYGTGGGAPDGLEADERLWEGYAAVGGGWEGEGMLAPALSGGVGVATARVSAGGTVQWGAAPSVWIAPRAAWSLGRGWALQLDLSTGYDAAAPTFVSGDATAAALGRLWVRPEVGLAWGPRYAGGTPVR